MLQQMGVINFYFMLSIIRGYIVQKDLLLSPEQFSQLCFFSFFSIIPATMKSPSFVEL